MALFTSKIVEIITSTNHYEQMARQKIGRVQSFMQRAGLPKELQQRCIAHLQHFMFRTSLTADTSELLRELSKPLRDEVRPRAKTQLAPTPTHRDDQSYLFILVTLTSCRHRQSTTPHPRTLAPQVNLASRRSLVLEMLVKSGWFQGFADLDGSMRIPDYFVKSLVSKLTPAAFSPADPLMVYGELGTEAFLIQDGVVSIPLPDGSTLFRGAGECVGEIAMITAGPRSTSVIAHSFVESYKLTREDFLEVCEDFPEVKERVRFLAAQRVQDTQQAEARASLLTKVAHDLSNETRIASTHDWTRTGAPPPNAREVANDTTQQRWNHVKGVIQDGGSRIGRAFSSADERDARGVSERDTHGVSERDSILDRTTEMLSSSPAKPQASTGRTLSTIREYNHLARRTIGGSNSPARAPWCLTGLPDWGLFWEARSMPTRQTGPHLTPPHPTSPIITYLTLSRGLLRSRDRPDQLLHSSTSFGSACFCCCFNCRFRSLRCWSWSRCSCSCSCSCCSCCS